MANENDKPSQNQSIDAGDLDGIDALLDEAEMGSLSDDIDATDIADGNNSLLDDLDADLEDFTESEEKPPTDTPTDSKADSKPQQKEQVPEEPADNSQESEGFLKRGATEKSPKAKNELTVAEMDSLKKLIIIFSSVLIALVVVAIGMGIWAALAAGKDKALDEASVQILEEIKSGTQQAIIDSNTKEESLQDIDKKLDSLNFQIGLLMKDLTEMGIKSPATAMAIDLASEIKPVQATDKPKQVVTVAPQINADVANKLTRVSSQITTTQRRIAEVNKRMKDLQSQYKVLLKTIKNIEKEMVKKRLVEAKDLEKAQQAQIAEEQSQKQSSYQMNPREGRYYW